ncbi:MAG: hypothetical protein OEW27_14855, partial [Aquincola sp.]|nr:hypothetical protein [Aquincola sp.]
MGAARYPGDSRDRARRGASSPRRGSRGWALPLSLALAWPGAQAAAYLPGAEADPPTGDVPVAAPSPTEPLRAGDIAWNFGPWRTSGSIALDLRAVRFDSGDSTRQAALLFDIDTASYLWQPWFMQVRLGAGLIAATDTSHQSGGNPGSGSGNSVTGRAEVLVFPASRFPFSL